MRNANSGNFCPNTWQPAELKNRMSTAPQLPADSDELLYRQVLPAFVVDGRPSSQAFNPSKDHSYLLSVDRSSLISAKDAFLLYTEGMRRKSAGTWAVTVAQCGQQSLMCFTDPLSSPPAPVA